MEHRLNHTDRGKLKYSQYNLSQCNLSHHKPHTDWPGISYNPVLHGKAPTTNRLRHGTALFFHNPQSFGEFLMVCLLKPGRTDPGFDSAAFT